MYPYFLRVIRIIWVIVLSNHECINLCTETSCKAINVLLCLPRTLKQSFWDRCVSYYRFSFGNKIWFSFQLYRKIFVSQTISVKIDFINRFVINCMFQNHYFVYVIIQLHTSISQRTSLMKSTFLCFVVVYVKYLHNLLNLLGLKYNIKIGFQLISIPIP